jgi:hypothetical protein
MSASVAEALDVKWRGEHSTRSRSDFPIFPKNETNKTSEITILRESLQPIYGRPLPRVFVTTESAA